MAFYQMADGESMSVGGGETRGTLSYVAYQYALFADVYAAAVALTPTGYGGGRRLDIRPTLLGGRVWRVDVEYGSPTAEKPALDENTPTALPGDPPAADPASIPPVVDPPAPLPPLEGQLGGPPGAGSFDPPADGEGGGQGVGTLDLPDRSNVLGAEWSFDTSGSTKHIVQSREVVFSAVVGGAAAPDLKGAIGSDKDEVKGVDIVFRTLKITLTLRVRYISGGYLDALTALTGAVNDRPFMFWAAGEVLMTGASGPAKLPDGWTITYQFEVSKNETNVDVISAAEVANRLRVPQKDGWDYLDVGYSDKIVEQNGKKYLRQLPDRVYVHRVYPRKNLSGLGFR